MQQFKIGVEGYKKLRKRWLSITLPAMCISALIFLIPNILGSKGQTGDTWLYMVAIFPIIFGIGTYRTLKRQKKFLESFSVTISDNEITREQMNTPPLTINFMEIKEISKFEKGSYMVKGAGRGDIINIPTWIEDREELEKLLQALAPIKVHTKDPWHLKYRWVLSVIALGLMLAVYFVDNEIVVGISGALLAGLIIWAIYFVLTSKNIPTNSKRRVWRYFLILAFVIYATYTKLTGIPLF